MSKTKNLKQIISDLSELFSVSNFPYTVKRFLPKKNILILAPHPDDECLLAPLAIRLQEENKMNVIAVSATLGSLALRQIPRSNEFKKACKKLHFKPEILVEDWKKKEQQLIHLLKLYRPSLIICSHDKDFHPTHIRTAKLLKSSLKKTPLETTIAWGEFWKQQDNPNCLVSFNPKQLHFLIDGLMEHKGEIARNPYHLRLPGRLMDNVRRASEWLGSFGGNSFNFPFGEIYRIEKFSKKKFRNVATIQVIEQDQDCSDILFT